MVKRCVMADHRRKGCDERSSKNCRRGDQPSSAEALAIRWARRLELMLDVDVQAVRSLLDMDENDTGLKVHRSLHGPSRQGRYVKMVRHMGAPK
jgi:hypothetical protein